MPQDLYHGVSEQSKAGIHRWDDARSLLEKDRYRGAMYLAGYSIECLLKAKLMRKFGCRHLRELEEELRDRGILDEHDSIYTHQLETLLRWADGFGPLRGNATLWRTFTLVNHWGPAWRYNPDPSNPEDAKDFLEAVDRVASWIKNNL